MAHVWVFSRTDKDWYMACWGAASRTEYTRKFQEESQQAYAKHLSKLGYQVAIQEAKPDKNQVNLNRTELPQKLPKLPK